MSEILIPKIKDCPPNGTGVHKWIFHACCKLNEAGFPPDEIEIYCAKNATRPLQPGEVINALKSIGRGGLVSRPMWRKPNEYAIESVTSENGTLDDLKNDSPEQCSSANEALEALFIGDPLLCCGLDSGTFATKPRSEWNNLPQLQFIVPSPMTEKFGETQAGKRSQHTLQNTGPRMYQVVEFDNGTHDTHAGVLFHLAKHMTLRCAVMSGGKSIHGWFDVQGISEDAQKDFFQVACQLGADPATWTRSQFVRMPNGRRSNGKIQEIIYFNPSNAPF